MIKIMIFDHDMTIVDSSYSIMAGFNAVARHEGLPEVDHEKVMEYIATPIPIFCEGLLGDYRPEWVKLYRQYSVELEKKLIKPFPDTVSTMQKLREMGVLCVVASNREYPSKAMKNSGIFEYFDLIVGAEEPWGHLPYKPNPAMILEILEHLDVKPEEAIYVGDSDVDIMTAIAADVRGVGITLGNFNAEDFKKLGAWKVVNSLSELLKIAESENNNNSDS